ncbi:MAG TPA: CDP-alcohol phosphatidyltransferase family protein [Dongiaceae bacterium]|nr:CDP-alcohol phosphatidyltransferase family protein [Dongiaceae bacterium]
MSTQHSLLITALPNLISLARLLAVPLAVWLILTDRYGIAFWVFVAAGVSDAIDGFIAKHFGARTVLGGYLDPLADKALLVSVYVTLGYRGQIENWLVILVVFRDVLIIGGAILYQTMTQSLKMQPLFISKINTAAQIALVAILLGKLGLGVINDYGLTTALVYIVAASTLLSGGAYVAIWGWRIFRMEDAQ